MPPDYFSETGQLWGNPVYDWQMHYQERFLWWRRRIGTLLRLVDLIRLDHFRGFEAYWRIPFGSPTAADGRWMPGPGSDFFAAVKAGVGRLPFIAEDLGFIDAKVVKLRQRWNLPGMRVLQFGFEALKPNLHSPHNYPRAVQRIPAPTTMTPLSVGTARLIRQCRTIPAAIWARAELTSRGI